MCIVTPDVYIATSDDAREFLQWHGIGAYQVEEFADILSADGYHDLADRHESLKEEFRCYEIALDAAQGVLNDVMNLCAELKERQRSATAQRALQAVYDLVYKSEAV